MSERSDEALATAARRGDRRAFEALVSRHYRALHRFAWRFSGDAAEAEDVAQEALIRIAKNLDGFEGRSAFRSWAFGITLNCARDLARAKARRAKVIEQAAAMALVEQAVAGGAEEEMEEGLWTAVRNLPEPQRDAVLLVHVEGLSHAEAAAALGCAEATVSWRLFSARRKLKSELSRQGA